MTNITKGKVIKGATTALCVGAPLGATISQFPMWIAASDKATVSGMFLVCAILSCLPFYRQVKDYFKSPASWVVWLVILVLFVSLRNIIDQMIMVCGIGLIANGLGTVFYKLGDKVQKKSDKIYTNEGDNIDESD